MDKPTIKMETGRRVAILRKTYGLNQAAFADMIGAKQVALSLYESGSRMLPPELAYKIKEKTRVDLDWLYFGDANSIPRGIYNQMFVKATIVDREFLESRSNAADAELTTVPEDVCELETKRIQMAFNKAKVLMSQAIDDLQNTL